MPEPSVALEMVEQDVTQTMAAWLEAQSDDQGFSVLLHSDEDDLSHVFSSALGDVAVPWTWTGVHIGTQDDDDRDVMGYRPTGRTVEVRGVTIVSDGDTELLYARFVDWVSALAEIGVPLSARPVEDVDPDA